jgi:hypothetical protein
MRAFMLIEVRKMKQTAPIKATGSAGGRPCLTESTGRAGGLHLRRGVAVVEFALTFPLLIILVVGLIEFSRLSTMRHAADNAAYEAARHVIVPGANVSEAIAQAHDLLARSGVRQGTIEVNPAVIGEDTKFVTVQVSVPLMGNSWLPPKLTRSRMVVRETTLRTERVTLVQGSATTTPLPPSSPGPTPPWGGGSPSGQWPGGWSPGSWSPWGGGTGGTGGRPRTGGGGRPRSGGGYGGGGGGGYSGGGGGGSYSGGGGGGGSSSGGGGGGGSSSGGGGSGSIQL